MKSKIRFDFSALEEQCLETSLEFALAMLSSRRESLYRPDAPGDWTIEGVAALDAELARIEKVVRDAAEAGKIPLEGLGTWEQAEQE